MDQGVISTFKALYLKKTFQKAIEATGYFDGSMEGQKQGLVQF